MQSGHVFSERLSLPISRWQQARQLILSPLPKAAALACRYISIAH